MAEHGEAGSYADINGLRMYYEIHGQGRSQSVGAPLVLLHGALSGIETSFGTMLPSLAATRQVVAVEMQGHARTADIDRPLTYEHLGADIVAVLGHLEIGQADLFGYSMGAAVALEISIRHPALVRKQVLASPATRRDGLHPGLLEGLEDLQPEHLAGTPFEEEYARLAPHPEAWPSLIEREKELDRAFEGWSDDEVGAITAPTLIVIGDSDIVRPEHAVELFRLFGGGVIGDLAGLPASQLAVLPGTTHITLADRADLLVPMIEAFLDAGS